MSAEAATAFAERLKTDEAFQSEILSAATPEERLDLAREAGFDLSVDDADTIKSALGIEEVSEEDLDRISGGVGAPDAEAVGGVMATYAGHCACSI